MARHNKKKTVSSVSATTKDNINSSSSGGTNANRRQTKPVSREGLVAQDTIKGMDDKGNFYNCHQDLMRAQSFCKHEFYLANSLYWSSGGYGGRSDHEAMVGDEGGVEDGVEGLAFLDRFLMAEQQRLQQRTQQGNTSPQKRQFETAMDVGAGVGRITKLVLLKRYGKVQLVEGDEGWSKRSRSYLGKKRASRCTFVRQRLDDVTMADVLHWCPGKAKVDLMWVQWTLQYLIDEDVVSLLKNLAGGLRFGTGIIIVKENRPFGQAREDRFQMDVPGGSGENDRYDITRSDNHHRLLFETARFNVLFVERGVETNTYVLSFARN